MCTAPYVALCTSLQLYGAVAGKPRGPVPAVHTVLYDGFPDRLVTRASPSIGVCHVTCGMARALVTWALAVTHSSARCRDSNCLHLMVLLLQDTTCSTCRGSPDFLPVIESSWGTPRLHQCAPMATTCASSCSSSVSAEASACAASTCHAACATREPTHAGVVSSLAKQASPARPLARCRA